MTVGKAPTPPESDEDEMPIHEPENNDSDLPRPQNEDNDRPQNGRQKAVATVSKVHPPEMIAKFTCCLKKSTILIIEDVRSHYAVLGQQPAGIVSDELRVGMKRAAAAITRSEYEIYSFATRHNLSEAATDELIQLVSNVRISSCHSAL